jgi:hypothetical protein
MLPGELGITLRTVKVHQAWVKQKNGRSLIAELL